MGGGRGTGNLGSASKTVEPGLLVDHAVHVLVEASPRDDC